MLDWFCCQRIAKTLVLYIHTVSPRLFEPHQLNSALYFVLMSEVCIVSLMSQGVLGCKYLLL